jgi:uncharacterized protein YdeI (YjbR/CyaY-like superfamily)
MEVYCATREEWRLWLEKNHLTLQEVWLVYYKKQSGRPRVSYNDAVEEALCFGWIDGKLQRVNDDYYIQRFTPRRQRSKWSKHNIGVVRKLIEKGIMKPAGLEAFRAIEDSPELIYDNRAEINEEIPDDLTASLEKDKTAFNNFINFPPSARRTYVYWLNSAKKDDTRKRRLERIVENAGKNIRPGL